MAVTEPALEAAATGDGSRPSAREHLLPSTAAAQETFLSDWFSHQLKITISMISQKWPVFELPSTKAGPGCQWWMTNCRTNIFLLLKKRKYTVDIVSAQSSQWNEDTCVIAEIDGPKQYTLGKTMKKSQITHWLMLHFLGHVNSTIPFAHQSFTYWSAHF